MNWCDNHIYYIKSVDDFSEYKVGMHVTISDGKLVVLCNHGFIRLFERSIVICDSTIGVDFNVDYEDLEFVYRKHYFCRVPFLYAYTVKILSCCYSDSFTSLMAIAEALQCKEKYCFDYVDDELFKWEYFYLYVRKDCIKNFCSVYSRYICSIG